MEPEATRRFVVHGRVQGVGFRAFVWRAAAELGLKGWVRNRCDGTVEVLAAGSEADLGELERRLGQGPSWSRVDRVEATTETEMPAPTGFGMRPDA